MAMIFLATMSSSRSDDVTKFVWTSVRSHFFQFGAFIGVLTGVQWCLKAVQWVFKGSVKGVSRMF